MNRAVAFRNSDRGAVAGCEPMLGRRSGQHPSRGTPRPATILERTPLTEHERAPGRLWGLSAAEWQRYRTLMEGSEAASARDHIAHRGPRHPRAR